jgi:hypothetical protein
MKKEKLKENDIESENPNISPKIDYQAPLPFVLIFILAGLFILIFSFVVHVECPIDNINCGYEYLTKKRIQQMAPVFISYGFLFIALTFWYFFYYWYDTLKIQREASILRIAADGDKTEDFL